MAVTLKLKKSGTSGVIPSTSDLSTGELAINYADGILYYKTDTGTISSIAGTSIGSTGPPGVRGSLWTTGSGVPVAAANNNDMYLNTANGDIYTYGAGSWTLVDNITGPQGQQGIQGTQGIQGIQGIQGQQGDEGPQGVRGSLWTSGAAIPSSGDGNNNDLFLYTVNGAVYQKSGGSWSVVDNLTGPTGTRGSLWTSSSGAPSGGIDSDYHLQLANGDVYTRSGGSWSVVGNIKGPQGNQGLQGIQGVRGYDASIYSWYGSAAVPATSSTSTGLSHAFDPVVATAEGVEVHLAIQSAHTNLRISVGTAPGSVTTYNLAAGPSGQAWQSVLIPASALSPTATNYVYIWSTGITATVTAVLVTPVAANTQRLLASTQVLRGDIASTLNDGVALSVGTSNKSEIQWNSGLLIHNKTNSATTTLRVRNSGGTDRDALIASATQTKIMVDGTDGITIDSSNVTIHKNLIVSGTTTTVNSTTLETGDNIFRLNSDVTGTPTENAGFEIIRGNQATVSFLWDETNDVWTLGTQKLGGLSNPTANDHAVNLAYANSNYIGSSGDQTVGGIKTFSSGPIVSNATPNFVLNESDAAADARRWAWQVNSGVLTLRVTNDANNSASTPISITRSGTTTSIINFTATDVQIDGNTIWHSGNDGPGSGLDADSLDTLNSSSFVRTDADSTIPTNILSFGATSRQAIDLWGGYYGIGVQANRWYARAFAGGGFNFFTGGEHSDTENDPGTGGTRILGFDSSNLTTTANWRGADGNASGPAISFAGATNLGLYNNAGVLAVSVGGTKRWDFSSDNFIAATTSGPVIINRIASATSPTLIPSSSDTTSGIGSNANGSVSIIAGGVEKLRIGSVLTAYANLSITGALEATTKSFVIKHPDPNKLGLLRHGSLEGPEHAVYVRGKSTSKKVAFPSYWKYLVDKDSITIHITSTKGHVSLKKFDIEGFEVDSIFGTEFFWIAYATRIDVSLTVEE